MCPPSTSSSWTMSCTVSIGTYATPSDCARASTRCASAVAGAGSDLSDRNALRTAASILAVRGGERTERVGHHGAGQRRRVGLLHPVLVAHGDIGCRGLVDRGGHVDPRPLTRRERGRPLELEVVQDLGEL